MRPASLGNPAPGASWPPAGSHLACSLHAPRAGSAWQRPRQRSESWFRPAVRPGPAPAPAPTPCSSFSPGRGEMTCYGLCPQGAFCGQAPAPSCASQLQACLLEQVAQEPGGAVPGVPRGTAQALEWGGHKGNAVPGLPCSPQLHPRGAGSRRSELLLASLRSDSDTRVPPSRGRGRQGEGSPHSSPARHACPDSRRAL